ncbi:MAG TPA: sensor histidine kinase [Usitatibacter sp.]|nr:sensor histidine kinase [Usitatibacter sp.]
MANFITENMEEIIAEWESFARTVSPASATMDNVELRDHVRQMLQAIALDVETSQTGEEQEEKSKGAGPRLNAVDTAAEIHGQLRHGSGFDLGELVAEFRALRASVLRIWIRSSSHRDPATAYQITRFNEAIDQALAESVATYSEELTRSRDTFLAILGHDLRSPLGALGNALHLLSSPEAHEHRDETLATGKRCVIVMSAMIQDLLEYTRTRLGKGIPITLAPEDLSSVCKAAFNEVSLVYPNTAFRLDADAALVGMFDATRMHQVVANLLNNAVQHGQRGFPVVLVAQRTDQGVVLQVKNRGRPIAPELLQVIFDPLVQIPTEGSTSEQFNNLGLGLFIAREIVLAHGGTIRASSNQEETQFTVEIPHTPPVKAQDRAPARRLSVAAR